MNGHKDTREGEPPPGTGSRSNVRFGARYTAGSFRADGAMTFGLASPGPGIGFTTGFTFVFDGPAQP